MIRNCIWSGTTICNTGYHGKDYSRISFIARFVKLLKEGYFEENEIDTFFLFGGTNDSWADSPLGEDIHTDFSTADLYNVFPAFSYLINLLVSNLRNTEIYCIINNELKAEIREFYKLTCEKTA